MRSARAGYCHHSFPAGQASNCVSAEVRNASLEEALRVILRGHDTFYMYAVEGQKPAALKAVWVYGRGEAKTMRPAAAEALKVSKEVEASLRDPDPAVRMRAFDILLERAGNDARNALISAVMQERDDSVRGRMVEALRGTGSDLPPELVPTLLNDPSEQIRILTLDSLRGSPNVREFATAALTDSSPHVRSRAQELLDETAQNTHGARIGRAAGRRNGDPACPNVPGMVQWEFPAKFLKS